MKKSIQIHQHVIHFRRWSRKGYAVFCSLGRCVSIRQLAKGLAEASLKKQKPLATVSLWLQGKDDDDFIVEDGDSGLADLLSRLWDILLLPEAVSTVSRSEKFELKKSDMKIAGQVRVCTCPAFCWYL